MSAELDDGEDDRRYRRAMVSTIVDSYYDDPYLTGGRTLLRQGKI